MIKYESSCDCCGKPVKPSEDGELIRYKEHRSEMNELHEIYQRQIKTLIRSNHAKTKRKQKRLSNHTDAIS